MDVCVGTSGFSYKAWQGAFYPDDLPDRRMLRFYAERLTSVEINNTFYRLPKASVLEGWASQVPEGFRFALKASRRITHMKRLKDAEDETEYLVGTARTLGPRLGVILFQLPPNLRRDVPRLERFLDALPAGSPAVFEFRHESWIDDEVLALLRARGASLCVADTDDAPAAELVATAPDAYLRLRRAAYTDAELTEWAARLRAAPLETAYVFFKHEDAGPRMAARFLELTAPAAARAGSRGARSGREAG